MLAFFVVSHDVLVFLLVHFIITTRTNSLYFNYLYLCITQFWNVESVGITPKNDLKNSFLDSYVVGSVECLDDGSYCARFPWKDSHPPLRMNFSTSAHRTRALARKLALNPSLLIQYNNILLNQEHCGFIEKVPNPSNTTRCHYILHHAILKDLSINPVCILYVYNCSCHQAIVSMTAYVLASFNSMIYVVLF